MRIEKLALLPALIMHISNPCHAIECMEDNSPPAVTCSVSTPILGTPNHNLVDVGLKVHVSDNVDPHPSISVAIYSDEDDVVATGSGNTSPDSRIVPPQLLLRQERKGNGDGRGYLIVVTAVDARGNIGRSCSTVVVPRDSSLKSRESILAEANVATLHCSTGTIPSGFLLIGDGPWIGTSSAISISTISPSNLSAFQENESIIIQAQIATSSETISKVEFFEGFANKLGEDVSSPYEFTWEDVSAGNYSLTSVAVSESGSREASGPVQISVNALPQVGLTEPVDGDIYTAPAMIYLEANACDRNDSIVQVDYFAGTSFIGSADEEPYSVGWTDVQAGSYNITAVATDEFGSSSASAPVTILINAPPHIRLLSPANGAVFTQPANIILNATASDTDGSIEQVDFFAGSTWLGGLFEAPYQMTWMNVGAGNHSLYAVATDNLDASTTDGPVDILVNIPPAVRITSPAPGAQFISGDCIPINAEATDPDGEVEEVNFYSGVDFYSGSTLLGTATSSPYSITWCNTRVGIYALQALAVDDDGATSASEPVHIAVCNETEGPQDNPIATYYGESAYPWTDEMHWDCVFDIGNFAGATMNERFNAARDAAHLHGGGVVYFPEGTYTFNDHLYLKNGVIIRGATPSNQDAKSSSFAPPTKFEFPRYIPSLSGSGTPNSTAFKFISTIQTNSDSNIGLVNLDINRAYFEVIAADQNTQQNRNIVAFGIRSNNAADPGGAFGSQPIPKTTFTFTSRNSAGQTVTNIVPFQHGWQRWPNRAGCNIKINAYENVLVANNRVNDAVTDSFDQPGYIIRNGTTMVTLTDGSKARFDYANHMGINVNRADPTGYVGSATPDTEPMLFRKGITVRDNWVYQTMWTGFQAAGDGLVVKGNIKRDASGKRHYISPPGDTVPGNSATFEHRGIDWSGSNVLIEENDYHVLRGIINDRFATIDGEGILLQACCGGTMANGATIRNNKGNAYIGFWFTRTIRDALVTENTVNNDTGEGLGIIVAANQGTTYHPLFNATISENVVHENIDLIGNSPGSGNFILNNIAMEPTAIINFTCSADPTVSGNTGFASINGSPIVDVSYPPNNSLFPTGTPITISADTQDCDGTISKVEFIRGSTRIATDTTSPFSMIWNVSSGSSSITARAFDNNNKSTTSNSVRVTGQ